MLILDRGVWIKYSDKLYDGTISAIYKIKMECDCEIQTNYDVIMKSTGEPIGISDDEIRFVRVMDENGGWYYVNYAILKRYYTGSVLNKEMIIPRFMYDKWCRDDICRPEHYGVKSYSGRYIRHDENALKEAINKMYGYRNSYFINRLLPKQVLLNGKYTTVVWKDGSHTVVKLAEGEQYDPEKAILYAIVKHLCGDVKAKMDRYLEDFDKVTVYKSQSKKEFLKECDAIDAAGGLNREYNPDEDETFFDDEEDGNDTE